MSTDAIISDTFPKGCSADEDEIRVYKEKNTITYQMVFNPDRLQLHEPADISETTTLSTPL